MAYEQRAINHLKVARELTEDEHVGIDYYYRIRVVVELAASLISALLAISSAIEASHRGE